MVHPGACRVVPSEQRLALLYLLIVHLLLIGGMTHSCCHHHQTRLHIQQTETPVRMSRPIHKGNIPPYPQLVSNLQFHRGVQLRPFFLLGHFDYPNLRHGSLSVHRKRQHLHALLKPPPASTEMLCVLFDKRHLLSQHSALWYYTPNGGKVKTDGSAAQKLASHPRI